jgi:hypothetical protein
MSDPGDSIRAVLAAEGVGPLARAGNLLEALRAGRGPAEYAEQLNTVIRVYAEPDASNPPGFDKMPLDLKDELIIDPKSIQAFRGTHVPFKIPQRRALAVRLLEFAHRHGPPPEELGLALRIVDRIARGRKEDKVHASFRAPPDPRLLSDRAHFAYEPLGAAREYSYRLCRSESDLHQVINYIHSVPAIRADEGISIAQRLDLYTRWMTWSPSSFLTLWRRKIRRFDAIPFVRDEELVAVSVILPLSLTAADDYWALRRKNTDFINRADFAPNVSAPPCIDLDIWVLATENLENLKFFGHWILPVHISLFWHDDPGLFIQTGPVDDKTFDYCWVLGMGSNVGLRNFRLGAKAGARYWRLLRDAVEVVRAWPVYRG